MNPRTTASEVATLFIIVKKCAYYYYYYYSHTHNKEKLKQKVQWNGVLKIFVNSPMTFLGLHDTLTWNSNAPVVSNKNLHSSIAFDSKC